MGKNQSTGIIRTWWRQASLPESSVPLALFRIVFGLLVVGELLDQALLRNFMGEFYFRTEFHFSYPGLAWLPELHGTAMQVFVLLLAASFLLLALGLAYRIVKWTSFLGFAYLFFLERAAYLNHWYLILLLGFCMLWIPAHQRYSLDLRRGAVKDATHFPRWMRQAMLLLVGLVYLFSGLAKLEPDWISGLTMEMVLQSVSGTGISAPKPTALSLLLAWGTIALELAAFPLLLWRPSRKIIFVALLAFHLTNFWLFTIGTFPFMMIFLTLLFIPDWFRLPGKKAAALTEAGPTSPSAPLRWLLVAFFALQIGLPLRHHFYPGNTLWTEEGRLFSWDMFLAFKGGYTDFSIHDPQNPNAPVQISPGQDHMTQGQRNKVFKNPDLILQFAHYIGDEYAAQLHPDIQVYAHTIVALNGRAPQQLHLSNVDLYRQNRKIVAPYWWVLPLEAARTQP